MTVRILAQDPGIGETSSTEMEESVSGASLGE